MGTDKRQQIMHAVESLFASRRFHEITVAEVARKAGVGKGTVYQYFSDKEDLFFQVAMAGYDDLCSVVTGGTEDSGPYLEVFRRVCAAVTEFYSRRRRVFHLMQAEDRCASRHRGKRRKAWHECKSKLLDAVRGLIDRGQQEGVFRSEVSSAEVAGILLALLRTGARRDRDAGGPQRSELVTDIFLHGLMRT